MKLATAIENLYKEAEFEQEGENHEMVAAIWLGIEALKQVQKFQKMGSKILPLRLPGETED